MVGNQKPDFENLNIWWDKGKLQMKDICWKFLKARAKAHRTQEKLLEKQLETLLSFPSTEETNQQISEICEKLGTIHRQKVADVSLIWTRGDDSLRVFAKYVKNGLANLYETL